MEGEGGRVEEGGILNGAVMAKYQVSKDQGERLQINGGSLAPRPIVKSHPTENQTPEYSGRQQRTQGCKERVTDAQRDPQQDNPSESDRYLRLVQGDKGGGTQSWDTTEDSGTQRGAQIRAAESCDRRVTETFRWTVLYTGRGGGGLVQDRRVATTNATDGEM